MDFRLLSIRHLRNFAPRQRLGFVVARAIVKNRELKSRRVFAIFSR
jgi:hypothetical protein